MSAENVEITRQLIDGLNQRDVDAVVALADASVEWESPGTRIEGGEPYRGHGGLRRYFADLADTWEQINTQVQEIRDLGAAVLTLGTTKLRSRAGVRFEYPAATLLEFDDGKLIRGRVYLDHDEALAAASAITGANT